MHDSVAFGTSADPDLQQSKASTDFPPCARRAEISIFAKTTLRKRHYGYVLLIVIDRTLPNNLSWPVSTPFSRKMPRGISQESIRLTLASIDVYRYVVRVAVCVAWHTAPTIRNVQQDGQAA